VKQVPNSSYIARVVDLPPSLAELAFDQRALRADGALDVSSGTFRSYGVFHGPASTPEVLHALRRAPGRLRPRAFGPSISVELELTPWSHSRTEVGLRYTGRSRPGSLTQARYFKIGAEVVETVVTELAAWPMTVPAADDRDSRAA
jgi:hypothetical protein